MAKDRLLVAGLAPEQHGDRMALFLQWKRMEEMPVMIDSYNVLGLRSVPLSLLIDESGVIRHRNPAPEALQAFLAAPPAEVGSAPPAPRPESGFSLLDPGGVGFERELVRQDDSFGHRRKVTTWNREAAFQLGVAFRKRHDSDAREPGDFERAIHYWNGALRKDPSNYIWRRRLQQYGPRLDKPYPFYDWIAEARTEVRARGEKPHPLVVEPTAAELARPGGAGADGGAQDGAPPHPDPYFKLPEQENGQFTHTVVFVPHTDGETEAFRVFVTLEPVDGRAKWNDEGGASTLRPEAPPNWTVEPAVLPFPSGDATARTVDFELRRSEPFDPFVEDLEARPTVDLRFFLHSCFGTPEICDFRRLDLREEIPVQEE